MRRVDRGTGQASLQAIGTCDSISILHPFRSNMEGVLVHSNPLQLSCLGVVHALASPPLHAIAAASIHPARSNATSPPSCVHPAPRSCLAILHILRMHRDPTRIHTEVTHTRLPSGFLRPRHGPGMDDAVNSIVNFGVVVDRVLVRIRRRALRRCWHAARVRLRALHEVSWPPRRSRIRQDANWMPRCCGRGRGAGKRVRHGPVGCVLRQTWPWRSSRTRPCRANPCQEIKVSTANGYTARTPRKAPYTDSVSF